ncbi:MAG: hypothetical protein RLZZ400_1030, partial [Actinomycetota bacterium]
LNANVTLYAEWSAVVASYTITYDANGATSGTAPGNTTGSGNVTLARNTGSLVLTNYTFVGWNTAPDGSGTRFKVAALYNLVANVTLYAEWELTPQVIYNPNGATSGTAPGAVTQGSPITVDPNTGALQRQGYKFAGWNTAPDGSGTTYAPGTTPNLPVGTVLYAVWIPVNSLAETGANLVLPVGGGALLIVIGSILLARNPRPRRRNF